MKRTLREFYNTLKSKYTEYDLFMNDCYSFTHEEHLEFAHNIYNGPLTDYYCEFIDVYSYYCDVIIEKSEDEQLITQSMLFYYMMNKEYFASNSEEDDIKNIVHIINQLEPHPEILDYEFFYETENFKVCCDLCNNEGDIPECVLCGRPAEVKEEKEIKRAKYKFNFDFNGPYCEDKDFEEYDEIFCNRCGVYIDSERFKQHCKEEHGGYIMVDTEANRKRNLQRDIIDQCESMGYDEGEINYILDNYKLDYFSLKYINKLSKAFDNVLKSSSDSDSSNYEDDSYENSVNDSLKCNASSSNNVSEDEI